MTQADSTQPEIRVPERVSFYFILGTLILVGWLNLATPLLAALFSYLALTHLGFIKGRGRWVAVALFLFLVSALVYGLGHFIRESVLALPDIADKAIPSIIQWAKQFQIELSFTDYDSLKDSAREAIKSQVQYLKEFAKLARGATTQVVFLAIGCVVAISIFLNPRMELARESHAIPNNLYSLCCDQIAFRFETLYRSFAMVMGAQIVISGINTLFTAIFVLVIGMPYAVVIIGVTFLCGLLPVIGNLISNTIIVGIGFTVTPRMAFLALLFLVIIHKLEYFLNSHIIGHRIRNPLWLTLLGLIVGERLMGVPGMILAPVVLHYVKVEAARVAVPDALSRKSEQQKAPPLVV